MMSRIAVVALLLSARVAAAQSCNLNAGGPDQLTVLVPSSSGTDFDLGWTGDYHDLQVPQGAQFEACLTNCDGAGDTTCDVEGYAQGQDVSGRSFFPPIPVIIGSVSACAVTTFREPFATGTADVASGEVDIVAGFSADVYLNAPNATTNTCPVCSGANVGDVGTCSGGANNGGACTTHDIVTVQNATDNPYRVSRDCLPSGSPQSTAFTVNVSTGTVTQNGLCSGQTDANDCNSGNCNASCTGGSGGISQNCCGGQTAKRCFPNPLSRTGEANAPSPSGSTFPKTNTGTLVGVFCAPAIPGLIGIGVNSDVGLAGPGAFVLPIEASWDLDPSPVTTTTVTTTSTTTTTLPECTTAATCADSDDCTVDDCAGGTCTHTPATGPAAVTCRFGTLTGSSTCGEEAVDPTLANAIAQATARAKTALDAIEGATPKKAKKLRKSATTALKSVLKRARKAAKKGAISTTCRDTIISRINELAQAIAGL